MPPANSPPPTKNLQKTYSSGMPLCILFHVGHLCHAKHVNYANNNSEKSEQLQN